MVQYKSLRENSTNILQREIKPYGVYRNMKGCILGLTLKDKVVIKTVYHFVDSNLGVEIFSKKREGVLEVALSGGGANDIPWRRKGLPGGPGVGGNYTG